MTVSVVELGGYGNHNLHGLLQTPEYARALYDMRRPSSLAFIEKLRGDT